MSHRDTDERLRTRLNADQAGRERLCAAILAIDRAYSHVEPCRPEGGPDGGRDIDALRDGVVVWGAVGFQNAVSDSPDDKRNAKTKFVTDLDTALRRKPDLKGFAFFTNVDLTAREREELEDIAHTKGIVFVDVYWRERLRHALDGVEGLAFRYQYLGMSMSDAEQTSFFSHFGSDLQERITRQHQTVVDRLDHIEALHHLSRPLRELRCLLYLRRKYKVEELGTFRALAEIAPIHRSRPSTWIGTEASIVSDERFGPMLANSLFWWRAIPEEKPIVLASQGFVGGPLDCVLFAVGMSATFTPEGFDDSDVTLFVSPGLEDKVAGLVISANGYVILEADFSSSTVPTTWNRTIPQCPWPRPQGGQGPEWLCERRSGLFQLSWSNPKKLTDAAARWRRAEC